MQADRAHKHTCPKTPARIGGVKAKNPNPNTPTTNPSQDWWGTGGAHTQSHTPQHPSQDWRGTGGAHTHTHTDTPKTQAGLEG